MKQTWLPKRSSLKNGMKNKAPLPPKKRKKEKEENIVIYFRLCSAFYFGLLHL